MGKRFEIDEEDDLEVVPIPLDRQTRLRLKLFANAIGKPPTAAATSLLSELLADDEFWNATRRQAIFN